MKDYEIERGTEKQYVIFKAKIKRKVDMGVKIQHSKIAYNQLIATF